MSAYITTAEAAALLGLSPETVRVIARYGALTRYYPAGTKGHGMRLNRREVKRLAAKRAIQPERAEP